MQLRLALDDSGRLHCQFEDGRQHAEISAYDGVTSLALLEAANRDLERDGCGECYWQMATGEYRLLFRRAGEDRVRIAVLWANGIVTGWENVFWTEGSYSLWAEELRRELQVSRASVGNPALYTPQQ